ncbi:hypothetical protein LTR86_003202 [Recurvomyces mirabilis]|nr:hypothetical protein LTR86_003202 [Recurvomyces mirabilis]
MNGKLPAGWRVSNSTGAWSAPSHVEDNSDNDDIDDGNDISTNFRGAEGGLTEEDLRPDSPGWEDVEDDVETESFTCLLCEVTKPKVRDIVQHMKVEHEFDFDVLRKSKKLDFFGTIQLINYVRSQVRSLGSTKLDLATLDSEDFMQDQYMQPTMEDDALLYSIDELADPADVNDPLVQQREDDVEAKAGEGGAERVLVDRALKQ